MTNSGRATGRVISTTVLLVLTTLIPQTVWCGDDPAMTRGEVRRVDAENGVLTIRHERIEHLDMPPMTMDFRIVDRRMLEGVGRGAPVEFHALDEGGRLVIDDLVVID